MIVGVVAAAMVIAGGASAGEQPCWEGEEMLTQKTRDEFTGLFATCVVRKERKGEVESVITRTMKACDRYERVSEATAVPWFIIAVIHNMECSGRWDCHLHNGDPLSARTRQVPANRPTSGVPPFTWEQSAVDALTFDGFDAWTEWSVAGTLYKLEAFNGLGYRHKGVPSPYLWAASQHYSRGKFTQDGKFSATAVSTQIGAAVLLRRMAEQGLIDFGGEAVAPSLTTGRVNTTALNVRSAQRRREASSAARRTERR